MPPTRSSRKTLSSRARAAKSADAFWAELQDRIWRPPLDRRAIRERLVQATAPLRERLQPCRQLEAEWAPVGVEVREVKMRARGLCSTREARRIVYVNQDDRYELKRFTVAHEVGHLLLGDLGPARRPISPREEELLCEQFAGRLLIDRELLALELGAPTEAPDPEQLLRLCGRYRVNIRPLQIAAGELLVDSPHALLLARRRGHPRRPHELAYRVEALAGARHSYLPRHQRLSSLGFTALDMMASDAAHGTILDGIDRSASVGLRGLDKSNKSATAQGVVSWRAIVQGHSSPFLLAALDLRELPKAPWGQAPHSMRV